jgi:hypothetical protein
MRIQIEDFMVKEGLDKETFEELAEEIGGKKQVVVLMFLRRHLKVNKQCKTHLSEREPDEDFILTRTVLFPKLVRKVFSQYILVLLGAEFKKVGELEECKLCHWKTKLATDTVEILTS